MRPKRLYVADLGFAQWFRQILGTYQAAVYMRDRGWSLDAALFNLLHIARRD